MKNWCIVGTIFQEAGFVFSCGVEISAGQILLKVSKDGVAKLMAYREVATKMENILQVLQFGGKLEANNGGYNAFQWCANYGNPATLKVLLEYHANINESAINGLTALHIAAGHNTKRMVQVLLNAKANLEAKTPTGKTALH